MDYLFLNKTKKQETKIKLGCLPTSAIVLTPLARHDDFKDAHKKIRIETYREPHEEYD